MGGGSTERFVGLHLLSLFCLNLNLLKSKPQYTFPPLARGGEYVVSVDLGFFSLTNFRGWAWRGFERLLDCVRGSSGPSSGYFFLGGGACVFGIFWVGRDSGFRGGGWMGKLDYLAFGWERLVRFRSGETAGPWPPDGVVLHHAPRPGGAGVRGAHRSPTLTHSVTT